MTTDRTRESEGTTASDIVSGAARRAEPEKEGAAQLLGLTGLRFWAAIFVVIYHFHTWPGLSFIPKRLILLGNTTVGMFFMLSGFVMAYTYAGPDDKRYRGAASFWAARFARIYPAYLLSLALLAPGFFAGLGQASPAQRMKIFTDAIAVLTLTQSWGHPQSAYAWNFPAWSLSVEAFFYLTFPLLLPQIRKLEKPRTLLACIAVVLCVSILSSGIYVALDPDHRGFIMTPTNATISFQGTPWLALLLFHPLCRLPQFVLGLLAGRLFLARRLSKRWGALLELAGASAIALVAFLSPQLPEAMLLQGILDPCFILLIFGLACEGGPLQRILSTRPMTVLGEASYGIYILQIAVNRWLGSFVPPVIAVIPASIAVYFLIERPARKLLLRLLTPRNPLLRASAAVEK